MCSLGEASNGKIITTAAESPWSNGVCEHLNGVIGVIVRNVMTVNATWRQHSVVPAVAGPGVKVKVGQRIKGTLSDNGEFLSETIISRADGVAGKYKNRYEVKR